MSTIVEGGLGIGQGQSEIVSWKGRVGQKVEAPKLKVSPESVRSQCQKKIADCLGQDRQDSKSYTMSKQAVLHHTKWSSTVLQEALVVRYETGYEDAMVATGVHCVMKPHESYRFSPDYGLKRVLDSDGIDVCSIIKAERAKRKDTIREDLPRFKITVKDDNRDVGKSQGNIFADATFPATIDVKSPVIEVPLLNEEELPSFGFKLIDKDQSFKLNSPTGIAPVMLMYVGKDYHKHIPGGSNIEKHLPLHLWIPMEKTCDGFILAGKIVENEKEGKTIVLGAIKIPWGKGLVGDANAWHSDSQLGNGVFLVSYGFPEGAQELKADGTTTYQPLYNNLNEPLSFKVRM